MFKTGTTSLQNILSKASAILHKQGVVYPYTTISQHSHWLNVRNPAWNPELLRELAEKSESDGASVLLLSGEAACALSSDQFCRLTAAFSKWPVEYIFCFRHWSSYLPSRWKQNCKRRDSQTFDEYLSKVQLPDFKHFDIRYDLILNRAKASGAKTVKAISWDNALEQNNNIIPEILVALELAGKVELPSEPNETWLNKSFSTLDVDVIRILNGLLDYKYNKKKDALFWAYVYHEECEHFHDIVHLFPELNPEIKELIVHRLTQNGLHETIVPNFVDLEEKLVATHGAEFQNRINGSIFHRARMNNPTFAHYNTPWQDFSNLLTHGLFAEFEHQYQKLQTIRKI
jgi:hypothetical protein